jgi:hypothetical protein
MKTYRMTFGWGARHTSRMTKAVFVMQARDFTEMHTEAFKYMRSVIGKRRCLVWLRFETVD